MSNEDLIKKLIGRSNQLAKGEFRIHNPNEVDLARLHGLEGEGYLTTRTATLETTEKDDGRITSQAYSLSGKGISALDSEYWDRLGLELQAAVDEIDW